MKQKHPSRMPGSVAFDLAMKKYREIYAEGLMPKELEARATISESGPNPHYVCKLAYWLKDSEYPFIFFQADVDPNTGVVIVQTAAPVSSISLEMLKTDAPMHIT